MTDEVSESPAAHPVYGHKVLLEEGNVKKSITLFELDNGSYGVIIETVGKYPEPLITKFRLSPEGMSLLWHAVKEIESIRTRPIIHSKGEDGEEMISIPLLHMRRST